MEFYKFFNDVLLAVIGPMTFLVKEGESACGPLEEVQHYPFISLRKELGDKISFREFFNALPEKTEDDKEIKACFVANYLKAKMERAIELTSAAAEAESLITSIPGVEMPKEL